MPHLLFMAFALLSAAEPPANPPAPPATALDIVSALETVLADAIAKAEPSVVAIARDKSTDGEETTAVRGRNPARRRLDPQIAVGNFDPLGGDPISFDYGSGVVVGEQGEILTAFHVVKGASRLVVRALGVAPFDAEIIAADPRSDLAVIAPRRTPGRRDAHAQAAGPGRRDQAAQRVVPAGAGQSIQRRARRSTLGRLGHPVERRPPTRTAARRPDAGAPPPLVSTRPCSSSTRSSTWA